MISYSEAKKMEKTLDGILANERDSLMNRKNHYRVKKEYLRSEAVPDGKDTVEESFGEHPYLADLKIPEISAHMEEMIYEKAKLKKAIADAEYRAGVNLEEMSDELSELERLRNSVRSLAQKYDTISWEEDTGYMLNKEGEQVTYRFPVKITESLAYDAKKMMNDWNRLANVCYDLEMEIEQLKNTLEVDYTPVYKAGTIIYDMIKEFAASKAE